jgi:hypothetical protein
MCLSIFSRFLNSYCFPDECDANVNTCFLLHITNKQYSILVTYYFALSISSGSMMNFGLEGESLGIFLIVFNSIMVIVVIFCANILQKKYLKEEVRKEWMVNNFVHSISSVYSFILFVQICYFFFD